MTGNRRNLNHFAHVQTDIFFSSGFAVYFINPKFIGNKNILILQARILETEKSCQYRNKQKNEPPLGKHTGRQSDEYQEHKGNFYQKHVCRCLPFYKPFCI